MILLPSSSPDVWASRASSTWVEVIAKVPVRTCDAVDVLTGIDPLFLKASNVRNLKPSSRFKYTDIMNFASHEELVTSNPWRSQPNIGPRMGFLQRHVRGS